MPAKSAKQARYMAGCAHNPEDMEGKCPPKAVAREFMHTKPQKKGKRGKGRS